MSETRVRGLKADQASAKLDCVSPSFELLAQAEGRRCFNPRRSHRREAFGVRATCRRFFLGQDSLRKRRIALTQRPGAAEPAEPKPKERRQQTPRPQPRVTHLTFLTASTLQRFNDLVAALSRGVHSWLNGRDARTMKKKIQPNDDDGFRRACRACEVCILAGGRSRRMGRDKARLRLGGVSLLARLKGLARALRLPARVIRRDAVPRCGPLGGIFTALKT